VRGPLALAALSLALVAVVAGMVAATGVQQASAATAAPGQVCIMGICLGPSPSPTSSPSATASPSAAGSSSPAPNPLPSVSLPLPTAIPSGSAGTGNPLGGVTASPSASSTKSAAQKRAAADPGLVASSATEVLTAGSATMTGLSYQGIVNVPVAGGGTVTMMKFTADSIALASGVTDTVTEGGASTATSSPALTFSGGVTLYATKLCGSLAGVPLCFTPTTVSGLLLSAANLITGVAPIVFTNVTTDQPIVLAGALQTGALTIG
jgi:hypothetical protein